MRRDSSETKRKILTVCVRLFLEQGYKNTTVSQIVDEAGVARGSYLNLFPTKDRILLELTETMFGGQFGVARSIADSKLPPVYAYAVETAIQLTLTELNENLREIYIEAYSLPDTSEYIYLHTTAELKQIFGEKFPDDTESDFYEMEIGTAGLMRSYMARKCDIHFPLERKLNRFLTAAMRVYRVPEAEQAKVLAFIQSLDIKAIATEVMYKLFAMLEMKYDFKLSKDSKGRRGNYMNKKILSVVLILCVMLAVMPMTAYAADIAFCSKCNRIQTVRLTYQYSNDEWHICNVTCTVCNNIWFYGMSHKWSGTATCTSGRTCTECGGTSEPLGHDWGAWTQNSDEKTHTRICKRDTSHTETENCHGGTATCTQRATCTVCGAEYGDALGHDFTTSWTHDDNEHWKQCSRCDAKDDVSPHTWDSGTITTAPTCTKAGKKTYSCTKCDATKIEPIPATGHSWKSDWTSDATHHWYECDNKNCDVTDNAGKKGYAEHSGGKATCTQNAVCEFCKAEYGEKLPHDFTAETVDAKYLKSAATCTEKAVYYKSCAVCGLSSEGTADEATFFSGNALDHNWGAWTQNSDEKTHTRICKRDTSHTETENCHGGTATCTAKAVCTVCGGEYGEMAAHSFTAEKAEAQYLKSAATCTEKAIYYKSCAVCGLSSEGTADEATFFSGNALDHDWGAWTQNSDEETHTRICKRDTSHTETENCIDANKDHKCDICDYIISECADDNKDHKCDYCGKKLTEHTGGKATCKDKAKCEVCGAEYGELDAKNHTDLKHFPATAATKTTEGNIEYWYCEGCGKYYSDKDGTKEIKKADTITAKLKDDSKSPQTGDTSNVLLWITLAVCQRRCSNRNNRLRQEEKAQRKVKSNI